VRSVNFTHERNVARITWSGDFVFIETEGNHDGAVVFTTVRVPRADFASALKAIGVLA
jgi:hypothetical protein